MKRLYLVSSIDVIGGSIVKDIEKEIDKLFVLAVFKHSVPDYDDTHWVE